MGVAVKKRPRTEASRSPEELCASDTRAQEFHGVPCRGDCSGHGYAWARQRDITREAQCERASEDFYEGCIAWSREYRFGYESARRDEVRDSSDCGGTVAEILGCEDYVEER
jgi:hypothetical protein